MPKKLVILSATSLLIFPLVVLAINFPPQPTSIFFDAKGPISSIIGVLWDIFVGISIIMFIWAGLLFATAQGDPSKISTAKKAFLWGIIGVAAALLSTSIPWILSGIFS